MKRALFLLAGLALWSAAAAQPTDLRIMSYNLRFGEVASMQQIGDYIARCNPDLVALQECDWDTQRERAPHQNHVKFLNELAAATGLFAVYGKALDYKGGYYGIGVLSKYPILRSERVLLPRSGACEQRVLLLAEIELPDRSTLTFVCTHLEVSSSRDRTAQTAFINDYFDAASGPVFLAGDMNAAAESPELQALTDHGWKPLTDSSPTYSVKKPSIKIDHIFYRGDAPVRLRSTRTCTDAKLSDHFPVISEVTLEH